MIVLRTPGTLIFLCQALKGVQMQPLQCRLKTLQEGQHQDFVKHLGKQTPNEYSLGVRLQACLVKLSVVFPTPTLPKKCPTPL